MGIYGDGSKMSYEDVGRKFGVSRQRIHQILKGYTTKRNKKMKKELGRESCDNCQADNEDIFLHHIDRNSKNNDHDNLSILCRKCHIKEHMVA